MIPLSQIVSIIEKYKSSGTRKQVIDELSNIVSENSKVNSSISEKISSSDKNTEPPRKIIKRTSKKEVTSDDPTLDTSRKITKRVSKKISADKNTEPPRKIIKRTSKKEVTSDDPTLDTSRKITKRVSKKISADNNTETLKKISKKNINLPASVRMAVWNKYIGNTISISKCAVGCGESISMNNFECGHVKARANGGDDKITNLRPICSKCNKSMGTTDMNDFINTYGLNADINNHEKKTSLNSPSTETKENKSETLLLKYKKNQLLFITRCFNINMAESYNKSEIIKKITKNIKHKELSSFIKEKEKYPHIRTCNGNGILEKSHFGFTVDSIPATLIGGYCTSHFSKIIIEPNPIYSR